MFGRVYPYKRSVNGKNCNENDIKFTKHPGFHRLTHTPSSTNFVAPPQRPTFYKVSTRTGSWDTFHWLYLCSSAKEISPSQIWFGKMRILTPPPLPKISWQSPCSQYSKTWSFQNLHVYYGKKIELRSFIIKHLKTNFSSSDLFIGIKHPCLDWEHGLSSGEWGVRKIASKYFLIQFFLSKYEFPIDNNPAISDPDTLSMSCLMSIIHCIE